jgi:glycosyltransferase involved in cell wall biosynthesis
LWIGISSTTGLPPNCKNALTVKILHVIIGLGSGGAEHMLRRLVENQHNGSGFHHSVVSLTTIGNVGAALSARGVSVHALGWRGVLNAPGTLLRLTRLIRRLQPDVIQTWMYHADLIGGLAARAAGKRQIIWGIRSTDMLRGTAYKTYAIRLICARLSRLLPSVIVCAAEASRLSHAAIGYDQSKMVVIANGFEIRDGLPNPEQRRIFRGTHGLRDDDVVVGCIGRYNAYKDYENFVRAAGLLANRYESVRFLMVGKGVELGNAKLCELIAATGFADRFRLLGFREDVWSCLNAMDVFCLSSRSEGFPNVIGEAMSIGVPCVATDVGDVRTLLADTGVIVPKENSSALYRGLADVVNMPPALREAMGRRGRSRVVDEYSMARASEKFAAIYKSFAEPVTPKANPADDHGCERL